MIAKNSIVSLIDALDLASKSKPHGRRSRTGN